MQHHLRFRQVHLDFHTSGQISGIGLAFDKHEWQQTLRDAHVNSITLFAKGHHGWHYNQTNVGHMHPRLGFDLLRAQFDASKEIDINVPIYISAGLDDASMDQHPEWLLAPVNPQTLDVSIPNPIRPGFRPVCFNSPYTEHLAAEIREVLEQFPNCDGIFLDIVHPRLCACPHCLKVMRDNGLDPANPDDLNTCAQMGLERYYQLTTTAVNDINPEMPIFHNAGHLTPGKRATLRKYFSHIELESLPTGGWGYDHFPLSAKYAQILDFDFLGMTGKFHTTWGEFGGFKHPNALRYECAAMLAFGAKCSIGDQLHPAGRLDTSTYRLIGKAYAEVEAKEPWCDNVTNVAEIAILPLAAVNASSARDIPGDIGAGRVLLEGHFLFDVIDLEADFPKYKLIILPDEITIDNKLKKRLDAYLAKGGHLLLTGTSGLDKKGRPIFNIDATCEGPSPFQPDYALPVKPLQPSDIDSPMVMYLRGQRLKPTKKSASLGDIYDPYFNRTDHIHFCSHQQTPFQPEPSGYACGVKTDSIVYMSHPLFSQYRGWGAVPLAEYLRNIVTLALGAKPALLCNMPSTARVSIMEQTALNRQILHLLYANIIPRGGSGSVNGVPVRGNGQVIEELLPLHDIDISYKPPRPVKALTLEPQGLPVPFTTDADGRLNFTIDRFTCHQMLCFQF